MQWWSKRLIAPGVVATVILGGVSASVALPTSPAAYGRSGSASRFSGQAFDTCTAPPAATMAAWLASPYRAVGIYVGGVNRGCAQPQLTANWVTTVSAQGWRLIPIYVGLQPVCTGRVGAQLISATPVTAVTQGSTDADDAIASMTALGLRRGSIVYADIEHYPTPTAGCTASMLSYVGGFTARLHSRGYLSGLYANLSSVAVDAVAAYASKAYARPDALWIARYDSVSTLKAWAGVPDTLWSNRQRAKQFEGNVTETYGAVSLNIDRDVWNAPVATVALSYTVSRVTAASTWSLPTTRAPGVRMGSRAPGAVVAVICQTPGRLTSGSAVWNMLTDGNFIADADLNTPGTTGYTSRIPRCSWAHQVLATNYLSRRSGPSSATTELGRLPAGALAWIVCQAPGTLVVSGKGATRVWDRLIDGSYVTDAYVATPGTTGRTSGLPRCL